MSESIENPHDKLVRLVFSDPVEAASFLQANLPESLSKDLRWESLTLVKGTFIDFRFQISDFRFFERNSLSSI